MAQHAPRQTAFTLIELLVVISIISVLVALLLPSLAAARENSRRLQCAVNMRSFGIAATLYDEVYRELPYSDTNSNAINYLSATATAEMRLNYGLSSNWFRCPSQEWPNASANRTCYYYFGGRSGYTGSDNVNGWRPLRFPGATKNWYPQLSISKADPDTRMPAFMGESYYDTWWTGAVSVRPARANHAVPGTPRSAASNFLFLDGHVATDKPQSGSWRLGGDAYGTLYWNPRGYAPYAGATVLP